jgi:hypothetical protein
VVHEGECLFDHDYEDDFGGAQDQLAAVSQVAVVSVAS